MPEIASQVERDGFVSEVPIGAVTCVRCHPDIVDQWATSAHRFASFNNPFYAATIDDMRRSAIVPNAAVEKHMGRLAVPSDSADG